DFPWTLPADAVNRMRMIAEILLQPVFVTVESKPCIRDPVRIRNQRITRVAAHIVTGPDVRRCRTQHIDASTGEAGDSAAGRRRKLDLRVARTEDQGIGDR